MRRERRHRRSALGAVVVLGVVLASGCATSGGGAGPSPSGGAGVAASGPLPSGALARVDGERIGPKELATALRAVCVLGAVEPDMLRDAAQVKPALGQVLDVVVANRLGGLAAAEAGARTEVDDEAWMRDRRGAGPEVYAARLRVCGITRAAFKAYLSEAMAASAYYEQQGQRLGAAEVRAGYALDQGRPPVEQSLMLRVIQVNLDKRGAEAAATRAQQLRAMLALGASFEATSRDFSDHPKAASGGELGALYASDLAPVVRAAVVSTPTGQISPVVQLPTSFMIFRVDSRGWDVSGPLNEALQAHYQAMSAGHQEAQRRALAARFGAQVEPSRLEGVDVAAALKATEAQAP